MSSRGTQVPTRLSVSVTLHHPSVGEIPIVALVDTGAEANLIKKSLLPPECFSPSARPLRFRAANHTQVLGGTHETGVTLKVPGTEVDTGLSATLDLPIVCYDADIGADMLLSYRWLATVAATVCPRKHGLLVESAGDNFWVPGIQAPPGPVRSASSVQVVTEEKGVPELSRDYFLEICQNFGVTPTLDCFPPRGTNLLPFHDIVSGGFSQNVLRGGVAKG